MKKLKSLKTFSGACWQHTHTAEGAQFGQRHCWNSAVPRAFLDLLAGHLLLIFLKYLHWVNFYPGITIFMLKMPWPGMQLTSSNLDFKYLFVFTRLFLPYRELRFNSPLPWFWREKRLVRQDNKTFPHLHLAWNSCEKFLPGSLVGISTGLWLNHSHLKNTLLCLWFLKVSLIFSIIFLHSAQRELGFFMLDISLSLPCCKRSRLPLCLLLWNSMIKTMKAAPSSSHFHHFVILWSFQCFPLQHPP